MRNQEWRYSMIVAGWAYRRGDLTLAQDCYSRAIIEAANLVRRGNPHRKRDAKRYRAAFMLMHLCKDASHA